MNWKGSMKSLTEPLNKKKKGKEEKDDNEQNYQAKDIFVCWQLAVNVHCTQIIMCR